jgi:hypothetical protein
MNWLQERFSFNGNMLFKHRKNVKLFKVLRIIRRMGIEWNKFANLKFLRRNKRRLFETVSKSFSFSERNSVCMSTQSLSEYTSLCLAYNE